jgi:hypothetical protein
MRSPPTEMDERERLLDSDEVAALRCTETARRIASDYDGIVMDSERVSHSDEYGYVYRYDIVTLLSDDRGGTHKCHALILLSTRDREMLELAWHSMYRLPDLKRNIL